VIQTNRDVLRGERRDNIKGRIQKSVKKNRESDTDRQTRNDRQNFLEASAHIGET